MSEILSNNCVCLEPGTFMFEKRGHLVKESCGEAVLSVIRWVPGNMLPKRDVGLFCNYSFHLKGMMFYVGPLLDCDGHGVNYAPIVTHTLAVTIQPPSTTEKIGKFRRDPVQFARISSYSASDEIISAYAHSAHAIFFVKYPKKVLLKCNLRLK